MWTGFIRVLFLPLKSARLASRLQAQFSAIEKVLPKDVTAKNKEQVGTVSSALRKHTCPFMDGQKEGPDDYYKA